MSSRERESRRSNVRRSNVTACTRCRSRKQRCDQNIPACSNCERAGVACVGSDIDGQVAPRSYIKSLEDRVAYLESQLANRGETDSPQPGSTANLLDGSQMSRDPIDQLAFHSLGEEAFSTSIASPDGQSLLRLLLAEPIRSITKSNQQSGHRSLLDDLPYSTRPVLPRMDAATRLIDAYFEHCEFFSPILSSKDEFLSLIAPLITEGCDSSNNATSIVAMTTFRAFIVFSVAVLLLNRTDSSFPVSRAEGYFAAAVQILVHNATAICTGDVEHIRNLVLIVQYCTFASNLTAAWHFIGLASRLAIELGLHDERTTERHQGELDDQRWLFWALYTCERNLCVIIRRPFSIPDEAIRTPLPTPRLEPLGDHAGRAAALHLIRYRIIESEIYTTLHQKKPLNGATLDMLAWRDGMRRKLLEWLGSAPMPSSPPTQLAPLNIFEAVIHNTMVILYYPSTAFPNPSDHDVEILVQSATKCIDCYKVAFRDGQLRFFWRTTHNLFRSGVAMAYCIHAQRVQNYQNLNLAEMNASVNTCMSILWAMVERFPAGRVYRDAFENLINSGPGPLDLTGSTGHMGVETQTQTPILFDAATLADMAIPQMTADPMFWGFGDPA